MTKITTNQYILIAVFCILTSKLMTMPAVVFEFAQKDAIFSIALNVIIDVCIVLCITALIKKYPNITFFELLKQKIKRAGAIIVGTIICAFLLLKGIFLLQETISFFTLALYENTNFLMLFIPALLCIMYISYKGLSAIGRSIDIYWIFVFFALVILFVISVMQVDATANLPYFENGIKPIISGSMHSLFYVGNGIVLLLFMGKVEQKPKLVRYTSMLCIFMGFFVIANSFIFLCLFKDFVPYCTFAVSHLSQYNPFVTELGHVGWLSIIESTINLIFMTSIYYYAVRQYVQLLNIHNKFVTTIIVGALYVVVMLLYGFDLYRLLNFVKYYAYWYNIILIPLVFVVCIVLQLAYKKPANKVHMGVKQNAKV